MQSVLDKVNVEEGVTTRLETVTEEHTSMARLVTVANWGAGGFYKKG